MMDAIKEEIAGFLFNIEVSVEASSNEVSGVGLEAKTMPSTGIQYTAADESGVITTGEISRNAPCPCGSGKKYKRCHGGS
jgi:preprotein translocase subunit SecA